MVTSFYEAHYTRLMDLSIDDLEFLETSLDKNDDETYTLNDETLITLKEADANNKHKDFIAEIQAKIDAKADTIYVIVG